MAIDDLENDPEFRKALPLKFLEIQMFSNEDKEQMKALLTKFNELVVSEELIEKVQHKFLSDQTPTFDGYFSTLLNLEDLNGKTMIRVRDNVTYKITDTENETILLFVDKKVRFPSYVKGALRFICDHVELAVSDIPNVLDESGKVVLARVLAKEGFVHVL